AVDDVVDPRVVARGAPVAVELDGLAREDEPRELVDREIGPLARTVDREEAQARDVEPIEVVRREEPELARALRRRVGRQRPQGREVPLLDVPRIERVEVVEPDDVVAARDEPLREVRADEASGAGDENAHARQDSGTPAERGVLEGLVSAWRRQMEQELDIPL